MAYETSGDRPAARPLRRHDCEQLLVAYDSDPLAVRALLPAPLVADGSTVLFAFSAEPTPGRGADVTVRVLLPAQLDGEPLLYCVQAYADQDPRSGAPHRYAHPKLISVHDTVCGVLALHAEPLAVAGMTARNPGSGDLPPVRETLLAALLLPQAHLQVTQDAHGTPIASRLVAAAPQDLRIGHAWSGAAQLHFLPYPPAPLADLPVRQVRGAVHVFAEVLPGATRVLVDYAPRSGASERRRKPARPEAPSVAAAPADPREVLQ